MSFFRLVAAIPAVLVTCAALGGCYDLSTSGPRPEDFAQGASSPQVEEQNEAHPASPTAVDDSDAVLQALDADPSPVNAAGAASPALVPSPR
jgi:hypothetical protein